MILNLFSWWGNGADMPAVRIVCCYHCGYLELPEPDSLADKCTCIKSTEFCECGQLRLVLKLYNR